MNRSTCVALLMGSACCSAFLGTSAAAQTSGSVMQEVIVTAQRRNERLQDVPVTVVAATTKDIERAQLRDSRDISRLIPGFSFNSNGTHGRPVIRGASTSTSSSTEANIAVYIDGIYRPSAQANVMALADVTDIQVLKGPQGTLFGRNATGGAVLITTRAPTDYFTGSLTLSASRYSTEGGAAQFKGFFSGPIIQDKLAFSIAGLIDRDGGFQHHIIHDVRFGKVFSNFVRGKLQWTPTDTLKFTLAANYTNKTDHRQQSGGIPNNNTSSRVANPNVLIAQAPYNVAYNEDQTSWGLDQGVSLKGEWDLSAGTVTSAAAWGYTTQEGISDGDSTFQATLRSRVPQGTNYNSQEINFTSKSDQRLRYVMGVFRYWSDEFIQNLDSGLAARAISTAYAGYGDGTFDVTDRIKLVAGIRYSTENKVATGKNGLPSTPRYTMPSNLPALGESTWSAWTPRVSLQYKPLSWLNLYATYSEGFRSGLYALSALQRTPADPEVLKSYEVGAKIVGDRFRLNIAAFHYNYDNLQVSFSLLNPANNTLTTIVNNGANAVMDGIDIDGQWQVTDRFDIRGGVSYLPTAKFATFTGALRFVPQPQGGNISVPLNATGLRLLMAPELQATMTATYAWPVWRGEMTASLTAAYQTQVNWEFTGRLNQPPYTTFAGELRYSPGEKGLSVALWGRNLSDQTYSIGQFISNIHDGLQWNAPREIGVSLTQSF